MDIDFQLTVNTITMKVEMRCDYIIVFPRYSIRSILGFETESYEPSLHISEGIPQVSAINVINVECNIVKGSFRNGKRSNTLYSFYPSAPSGYKLVETPSNILFLPVSVQEVSNVTLRLTDQSGNLIHLNNEEVTIHLILREI